MRIFDSRGRAGAYLPIRHVDYDNPPHSEGAFELDLRAAVFGARILDRLTDTKRGQIGHYVVGPDDYGDFTGWMLWDRGTREVPTTREVFPTVASVALVEGGAATFGRGGPFSAVVVRKPWQADDRLALLRTDQPAYLPEPVGGLLGLTVQAQEEREQLELWYSTDPRMVAPDRGGREVHGSIVCDVDSDGDADVARAGRLQTHERVVHADGKYRVGIQGTFARVGGSGYGLIYGTGDGGGRVVNQMSWERGGFYHPGHASADKHKRRVNAEGEPEQPGHLWIDSLFYKNIVEDGPLHHTVFVPGGDREWPTRVRFGFNFQLGKWDWWTTTPVIPPPWVPGEPPTDKVPPTRVPGEGVPTGGGGGNPPGVPAGGGEDRVVRGDAPAGQGAAPEAPVPQPPPPPAAPARGQGGDGSDDVPDNEWALVIAAIRSAAAAAADQAEQGQNAQAAKAAKAQADRERRKREKEARKQQRREQRPPDEEIDLTGGTITFDPLGGPFGRGGSIEFPPLTGPFGRGGRIEFTPNTSPFGRGRGRPNFAPGVGEPLLVSGDHTINPALHEYELAVPSLVFASVRDRESQPYDGRYGGPGRDSAYAGDTMPAGGRHGALSQAAVERGGPSPLVAHLWAEGQVSRGSEYGEHEYKSQPGEAWGNGTARAGALYAGPHVLADGPDDQSDLLGELDVLLYAGHRGGSAVRRFGWGTYDRSADVATGFAGLQSSGSASARDLELRYTDGSAAARAGVLTSHGHIRWGAGSTYSLGTAAARAAVVHADALGGMSAPATAVHTQALDVYARLGLAPVAASPGVNTLWIKDATPTELWFTDSAGTDTQLA